MAGFKEMIGPALRVGVAAAVFAMAGASVPAALRAQDLGAARLAARTGEYDRAVSAYAALTQARAEPVVYRERAQLLAELGRYDEAEAALAAGAQALGNGGVELQRMLGEILMIRGKLPEAQAAFTRAVQGNASDRNVARYDLAFLQWRRGERQEAIKVFDTFIDLYNTNKDQLSADELMAVGDAVRLLAPVRPLEVDPRRELFQDALHAYDRADVKDPSEFPDPRPAILAGELFLEKYEAPDAHESFAKVLFVNPKNPRALLGEARTLDFDGDAGAAAELTLRALETNPSYADAHTFRARLSLKAEQYDSARAQVARALRINPVSLEALSVQAAIAYLSGDRAAYQADVNKALAINPIYPDLYNTIAELSVEHRQYRDAVELAQKAVQLDSLSWWGWGILGVNQLRTGQIEVGKANIEKANKGDPYNPWYLNTLKLTDTFSRYRTVKTEHFELFLNESEAALIEPYAVQLAEEAYAALKKRYNAEPPLPIRVEVFPSHGDFSVRTLGLPGLGALGVSFGSVLVMDSPSARPPGEFNWQSTLWHELAHAFHLAMTDFQVPRWFSEGLAVHEQRLARPNWGFRADPGFLMAYQLGKLHPVSDLNRGFVEPKFPEEVLYSYLEASLVFDMLEQENGASAILAMMRGYKDGKTTDQLVREVLRTTPEELDKHFDQWFRAKYAAPLRSLPANPEALPPLPSLDDLKNIAAQRPGEFVTRLALGQALVEAKQVDDAERELKAAIALFPEYHGADSPWLYLAAIYQDRGQLAQAADAMHRVAELDESALNASLQEATVRKQMNDSIGEARALEVAVQIFPYDIEVHQRLAALYAGQKNFAGNVRERRAVLALKPVDMAAAHYELAKAYLLANDRTNARTQVLRALELAPAFTDAQELLLLIRGPLR
jgi:cellulose synthase operon protein C